MHPQRHLRTHYTAGTAVATLAISGTGGSSASVRLSGTARLNPVLAVGPAVIVPGQVVTIAGTNFPAGVPVMLTRDVGGAAATAVADGAGSFSVAAVVPAGLGSGTRRVLVASPPEAAAATAAVSQQLASDGGPGARIFENSPALPLARRSRDVDSISAISPTPETEHAENTGSTRMSGRRRGAASVGLQESAEGGGRQD